MVSRFLNSKAIKVLTSMTLLLYTTPAMATPIVYGNLQVQNNLSEFLNNGTTPLVRSNLGLQGYAATNAALIAFPVSNLAVGSRVTRGGYYNEGDSPAVDYSLSTTICPQNAGLGDKGSCIPSNTAGYYWNLTPQTSYDPRDWGAVPGGTDPYYTSGQTGNALAFNSMFTFVTTIANAISTTAGEQGIDITGAGLIYGVNYPVIANTPLSYIHDMAFVALSSTNFPCTTTGLFMIETSTTRRFARIYADSNRLPVNSITDQSNGSQKLESLYARHWEGICSSYTTGVVATITNGSNIIAMSNTSGLTTGMVSRGNTGVGIPDRAVILQIVSNTSILVSKTATASASSASLIFDVDPSGVVLGLNGSNTGDEFNNLNSVEWNGADSESGVTADRYGYALEMTGGANDISLTNTELTDGIVSLYADFGVGGFRMTNVEIANSSWSTTETNPYAVLIAPEVGSIQTEGMATNVPFAIFTDGNVNPFLIATQTKYVSGSGYTESPGAVFQVYVQSTNINLTNIYIDPFNNYIPNNGYALYATYGPGTIVANENINYGVSSPISPSGIIATSTRYTSSGSITGSHIGGSFAGTFTSSTTSLANTITINGATGLAAPNGWACPVWDETTPADKVTETSTTTTTASFSGTVASGDTIGFTCTGY